MTGTRFTVGKDAYGFLVGSLWSEIQPSGDICHMEIRPFLVKYFTIEILILVGGYNVKMGLSL